MKPARFPNLNRKMLITGSIALTVAAAVGITTAFSPALAQQDAGNAGGNNSGNNNSNNQVTLTAIPPRLGDDNSIVIAPGEKQQVQVRVRNSSPTSINVATLANDFIIGEDGFTPVPVQDEVSNRWSLASWLTIVPQSQEIGPNQTGAVEVLIEVPEDALPGGHYAMITHQPAASAETEPGLETETNSASIISQKVGTLLYVKVDGPINEEAFVREFTFPNLTEFGPVPFSYTVENASDIHITPRSSVEIFNMLGKKVDTIEVEPANVFPLMSRKFESRWDQVWGTGLYTAKLTMSYGDAGKVAIAQTKFWLLPIKLIMAVIILILTTIAIIVSARRHYLHRASEEQQRIKMLEERLKQAEGRNLDQYED